MDDYDDINTFRKKSGLNTYKVLSEYNVMNVLADWEMLTEIKGESTNKKSPVTMVGVSEFVSLINSSGDNNLRNSQNGVNKMNQAEACCLPQSTNNHDSLLLAREKDLHACEHIAHSAELSPLAPSVDALRTEKMKEKTRFSNLFKSVQTKPEEQKSIASSRSLPLKTLFNRIASCR